MDTLRNLLSSMHALAVLGIAVLAIAVTLTFAGAPLPLLVLMYVAGAVFAVVWWLMNRD